jgi:hypothetical protein
MEKATVVNDKVIDTLFVFASNRSQYIFTDQMDAIRWTCEDRSFHVAVIDDGNNYGVPGTHGDYSLVHSKVPSQKHLSGFKNNEALRWAIDHGYDFQQVIFMDDDSLPIRKGLDAWSLATMGRTGVDLLGVEDRVNYQPYWHEYEPLFREWGVDTEGWYPPSASIFYATCFLSRAAALNLYTKNLLVPRGCDKWTLWPDIYLSWIVALTNGYVMRWGHMDQPRAPLYLNHMNHMRHAPDPRILHEDFLVYHTLKGVHSYSEEELREIYKKVRAGLLGDKPTQPGS